MTSKLFFYSLVNLHWGFIIRQLGASAAQLVYPLPPPPTIVGAFMNPISRLLGLGEEIDKNKYGPAGSRNIQCGLRATLAASAGLNLIEKQENNVGIIVHAEPSRIIAAPYKTGGSYTRALKKSPYEAIDELAPVQAEGYSSAPNSLMNLVWFLDIDVLLECLGAKIEYKDLKRAIWGIYRLGSKEGIISVVKARIYEEDDLDYIVEGSNFKSILYQKKDCVTPIEPIPEAILYDIRYRETSFYIPSIISGSMMVIPTSDPVSFIVRSGCEAVKPKEEPYLSIAYKYLPR